MHYTQKKAATKMFAHLSNSPDDLKSAIKNEYPDANELDIDEIMASIKGPKETKPLIKEQIMPTLNPPNPNAALADKLKEFDYDNLVGSKFRDYCLFVQSLQLADCYFFEQYKVEVQKKVRYRGVKDSPTDVIGFKIVISKPLNTTKIPVKIALTFNGTVKYEEGESFFETIGSQIEHNGKEGRYFLLKK